MKTAQLIVPVLLYMVCCHTVSAQSVRGRTDIHPVVGGFEVVGQAESWIPAKDVISGASTSGTVISMNDWKARDSIVFDSWLNPGATIGVRFNHTSGHIERIQSMPSLHPAAVQAVQRSPRWLRTKLEHTFSILSTVLQQKYAAVINQAVDPYVDEVAFAIANSSATFLSSSYCFSRLFTDNAELLYDHDKLLPYVEIVDYGQASGNGDYYSTVRYWRRDADSNRVQVEVPKEIYYWYVVHPKLSDEISTYVDPARKEGLNAIVLPPVGVFWRDYLFSYTESVPDTTGVLFPVLRDLVSGCDVLWDETGSETQAVREITKWIKAVLRFTSGSERPHQPARIYKLHMGRCGEHEDVSSAAARACLIPSRGIGSYSTDHVWNEFWDTEWCQWEPVNNSFKKPLVYSEGWGKKFGSVMARRSDGQFIPVTDRYALGTAKLIVRTVDTDGRPIDGASVMIAMRVDQNIVIDTYGSTNIDGIAEFIVGKGNEYYARFDSPFDGSYPTQSNQVTRLMTNTEAGRTYNYQLKSVPKKNSYEITEITPPVDEIHDFRLSINFVVAAQATRWHQRFDDINAVGTNEFFVTEGPGHVSVLTTDSDNDTAAAAGGPVEAFHLFRDSDSGSCLFSIPADRSWYTFFLNERNSSNPVHVRGTFTLLISPVVGISGNTAPLEQGIELHGCLPHPVGPEGSHIRFSVPDGDASEVRLEVFDLLGRLRSRVFHAEVSPGTHDAVFIPDDLAPGTYMLRLSSGTEHVERKMVLLR